MYLKICECFFILNIILLKTKKEKLFDNQKYENNMNNYKIYNERYKNIKNIYLNIIGVHRCQTYCS